MTSDLCGNCGHSRATHEVIDGYQPYGHCNHGHDLCGCKKFVAASEALTEVKWPTPSGRPFTDPTPRPPSRIDAMLAELRTYWLKHPDLRLGQIVGNLASGVAMREGHQVSQRVAESRDPYYIEDVDLLARLRAENP